MSQLHTVNGTTYIVERKKRREVFPYDERRANPLLWFGFDLETRDIVATGTLTRRECLGVLGEASADVTQRKEK